MKRINWDKVYNEPIPVKIDMWYNRNERSWVVQLKDKNDFQIGAAIYVYSKKEALKQVEDWKEIYGLS